MTQVGSVYGDALYELALAEGLEQAIMDELQALKEGFRQEPDFVRLLCSPNIAKQERCQILDDCFRGKIQPYLLNFLKILTEKGYMQHFSHCCDAYAQRYQDNHNILSVNAVTAVALNDRQTEALTQKLTRITGKTILLHNRVDPSCLGGVRLDYDGRRLDDTISHRMASVRELLNNTVL